MRTSRAGSASTAWYGTPHIGIARARASFAREVSVSSSTRDAVERVLVEHLVEVAHAEEHDRVAVLPLDVEVLPHGRRGRVDRRLEGDVVTVERNGDRGAKARTTPEYNIAAMVILALETVTRAGSLALVDGRRASRAMPATPRARTPSGCRARSSTWLRGHGRALARRRCLAVVTGPGSFTGLRVGIAAIQGLALARAARSLGVPTLEAMAGGWLDHPPAQPVVVVACLDGQRGDVFFAAYATAPGVSVRPAARGIAPKVAQPEDAAHEIAALARGRAIMIVGDSEAAL